MQTKADKAAELFITGFSCAQSVTAAFCEEYDMEMETGLKIACPLGGGCGLGELCGAISGGAIIVGLKYGQYDLADNESKANCRAKRDEFVDKFIEKNESATCRELLGVDILTEEGEEEYKRLLADRATSPCAGFVKDAALILEEQGY